jgi:hypothetical protein
MFVTPYSPFNAVLKELTTSISAPDQSHASLYNLEHLASSIEAAKVQISPFGKRTIHFDECHQSQSFVTALSVNELGWQLRSLIRATQRPQTWINKDCSSKVSLQIKQKLADLSKSFSRLLCESDEMMKFRNRLVQFLGWLFFPVQDAVDEFFAKRVRDVEQSLPKEREIGENLSFAEMVCRSFRPEQVSKLNQSITSCDDIFFAPFASGLEQGYGFAPPLEDSKILTEDGLKQLIIRIP